MPTGSGGGSYAFASTSILSGWEPGFRCFQYRSGTTSQPVGEGLRFSVLGRSAIEQT